MRAYLNIILCLFAVLSASLLSSQSTEVSQREGRIIRLLNDDWKTIQKENFDSLEVQKMIQSKFDEVNWKEVSIPHNWDQYYGYRRMKHGNLHGSAWYRKQLKIDKPSQDKHYFLFFEGVGSYATVWVNGIKVGSHKGGRTSFTIDITEAVNLQSENTILVEAAHPPFIADLPWVCGGCSGEWGFSEGSQPMGIFRPVSLIETNHVKIEPFGVHVWNDTNLDDGPISIHTETELKNYGQQSKNIKIIQTLMDAEGVTIGETERAVEKINGLQKISQDLKLSERVNLWSPETPYLYNLVTSLHDDEGLIDQLNTPYGIRSISWPIYRTDGDQRFRLNGNPYFINGTCEYEHLMGKSHSFTDEMIESRVEQMVAGGFNAFREAHQPHNLRYQELLDEKGILFWSQFSAHIWYDTPEFKENFKTLLREWIKERRNNPSVIMWGLQNESTIPEAFARECMEIIRELDPTSSGQRLVTTCNGGEGTDWNVIQNWSGTYGGDPFNYGNELKKDLLNGEYGAWRTTDLYTEGEFDQDGIYSENRFSQLMEIKVREAELVKDSVVGHFNWLFNSHENPGRIQNGEAYRDMDQIGPVNYKGLFTAWGEPTDAFYMYRANYAPKTTEPMVYIVSHTWPSRWNAASEHQKITVYSNCDEVELFNDVDQHSYGKLKNKGIGTHFEWTDVSVEFNVLQAKGYVDGKEVATDIIVLNHLPESENFMSLQTSKNELLKPKEAFNYIYRVNAGGPKVKDAHGNEWLADVQRTTQDTWGSTSWTDKFKDLPAFYASQRRTFDPIKNTADWSLFQNFRYGMDDLKFEFPAEAGDYIVELYFIEPWYGTGGGLDCDAWRLFDVAINDELVLKDFDIWKEAGHDSALKKSFNVSSKNGLISISFPNQKAGQALISAIAIATRATVKKAEASPMNIGSLKLENKPNSNIEIETWMDLGQPQYINSDKTWSHLPYQLFGSQWIRFSEEATDAKLAGSFQTLQDSDIYVLVDSISSKTKVMASYQLLENQYTKNDAGELFSIFHKKVKAQEILKFSNKNRLESNIRAIVVQPSYEMGEGEEVRASVKLEAETASIEGKGYEIKNFKKSDYLDFQSTDGNSISWKVSTGLAGIHLLRFRFMNMNPNPVKMTLQILAANGNLVREDIIEFSEASEKWKILNTTTGGYINAGTYTIKLSSENFKGVRLESFEFQ